MTCSFAFIRRAVALAAIALCAAAVSTQAATVTIPAGGNLQAAVDAAVPGDTLLLQAGATFVGPIYLRYKPGMDSNTNWITIRTSTPDGTFPAAGTRISPASAPLMPKIVSPGNNQFALLTEPRAHHYRMIGIEFAPTDANAYLREIVGLGDGSVNQNAVALIPHHLEMQRCYVHAYPTQEMVRAISLNSASTNIVDSYVSEIHSSGYDSQAIWGWNGPGPYDIINNYLEASGENIGFGGAQPSVTNQLPSNIRILHNHIFKQPGWKGSKWLVKNLMELKLGDTLLIEGNVFENVWANAQAGIAIVFTVRDEWGTATWSTIRNVTFRNNIIKNSAGGLQILGKDDDFVARPSVLMDNIVIENNVFWGMDTAKNGGDGFFLKLGHTPTRLKISHNTATGNNLSGILLIYGMPVSGAVITDNLVAPLNYAIVGEGNYGMTAWNQYLPNSTVTKNVLGFLDPNLQQPHMPPGNILVSNAAALGSFKDTANGDFSLVAGSPYRGVATDGTDVGANITALNAALAGVALPAPRAPLNVRVVQ